MISALITNFNYGRWVTSAIESVLNQTCDVAEVIVIDDGSTDDSRRIIIELAEREPRIIPVFQANAGQASAINAGFARCTGDIVCMLDADDEWDRGKVECVSAAFAAQPEAVMVMHRYRMVDLNGKVLDPEGSGTFPEGNLDSLMVRTGGSWVFGATSSLSLRRCALERILPMPAATWKLCADGAIAYAAAFLGRVVSLPDVLGSYRIHGANNHFAAGRAGDKIQADVEMTNRYLNDFLARIGRSERVDLMRNLQYRRDRFYRQGGGISEAMAISRLILNWPLYTGPAERAKYLMRFALRAAGSALQ